MLKYNYNKKEIGGKNHAGKRYEGKSEKRS